MRTGLFFLRRERICAKRSISLSLPTTGSSAPSAAAFVKSYPNLSMAGVSVLAGLPAFAVGADCLKLFDEGPNPLDGGKVSSSSSSSNSTLSLGCAGAFCELKQSYMSLYVTCLSLKIRATILLLCFIMASNTCSTSLSSLLIRRASSTAKRIIVVDFWSSAISVLVFRLSSFLKLSSISCFIPSMSMHSFDFMLVKASLSPSRIMPSMMCSGPI